MTGTDLRYLVNPLTERLQKFLLQRQELLKDCFEGDFIESVALRVYYNDYFQIAKLMREHQHGGMLLIVPPNDEWKKSMKNSGFVTSIAYEKAKKSMTQRDELLKERNTVPQNTNEGFLTLDIFPSDETKLKRYEEISHNRQREEAIKLSEKYLSSISRLTAIDGATVIGFDFSILTFGAKIETANKENSKNKNEIMFKETFPFEDSVEDSNPKPISEFLRGTKHHSAIQFVFDNPDSLAFVASQDGQVSVIYKENDIIRIISNAEYLFI